ncbi:MAG: hypothetical protein ACYCWE_11675 [Eubacteriales bacterium]
MNFKFVSIILLLAMTFSAAACSKKPSDEIISETASQVTETSDTLYTAELPIIDFNGYVFRLLSCTYPNGFSIVTLADAEEQTGDLINDAIYKRNVQIEDEFNIVFQATYAEQFFNMTDQFRKSVTSASDDFDLNMLICRDAFTLAQQDMMITADRLPYVDITQPWYVHTINDELSISGKLFFAYSDDAINLFEWTNLILFNKKMAKDYNIKNMYDMVRDGSWTMDELYLAAGNVISDINGDNVYNDNDRLGVISESDFYYPAFWIGAGLKTVQKDSDDIPYLAVEESDKFYTMLTQLCNATEEKGMLFDMFSDKPVTLNKGTGDEQRIAGHTLFANGVSLFHITNVGTLQNMRAMDDDFGILPIPKYSKDQERYYSRTIDGWLYCVPVTNTYLERTSIIMESMAVGAKNYMVPAYYETALKEKYTRDPDSEEMFSLIYNTRAFDMGDVYWMDAIRNTYVSVLTAGKTDFASATQKKLASINKVINNAIEAIKN